MNCSRDLLLASGPPSGKKCDLARIKQAEKEERGNKYAQGHAG